MIEIMLNSDAKILFFLVKGPGADNTKVPALPMHGEPITSSPLTGEDRGEGEIVATP